MDTDITPRKTICIFAGARGKSYLYDDARLITSDLVRSGWDILYGGSSKGVMGAVCETAKKEGGRITGVLPRKIAALKHFDPDVNMIVTADMSSRKQVFWDNSDAFLLLPGAYGSLDELFEILALTKLGYQHKRPIIVYNQLIPESNDGFYDALENLLDDMVCHGLMETHKADLVKFVDMPFEVCQYLREWKAEAILTEANQ